MGYYKNLKLEQEFVKDLKNDTGFDPSDWATPEPEWDEDEQMARGHDRESLVRRITDWVKVVKTKIINGIRSL